MLVPNISLWLVDEGIASFEYLVEKIAIFPNTRRHTWP
jgi:hypothetical protein